MEWNRVKTILILTLLGVNLFLLGNLVNTIWRDRRIERQALDDAMTICRQQGIDVAEGAVALDSDDTVYVQERDYAQEEAAARALLGEDVTHTAAGGGVVTYAGDGGSASFRNGGYFEMRFAYSDMPQDGHEAERLARTLAKRARLATDDAVYMASDDDGVFTVTVQQCMGEKQVYNMSVTIVFAQQLVQIDGRLMPSVPRAASERAKASYEALLDLVSAWKTMEITVQKISDIEQGYYASITTGGSVLYVPLWRIQTDTGTYHFDLLKGQFVTIE